MTDTIQYADIGEFIAEHSLTMEATPVSDNPNMEGMSPGSQHYYCDILGPHGSLQTFFSVGPGTVDAWLHDKLPASHVWRVAPKSVDGDDYRREVRQTWRKEVRPSDYRPELADVLDCLASDAVCVENCRSFEEFAADLGYDEDSRKAEKTYNIILEQSRQLRLLLGWSSFESLLWNTERM